MSTAWYFVPGTELRMRTLVEGDRYGLRCPYCGTGVFVGPSDGVCVAPDGALSTTRAFTCPSCGIWHARLGGGVVQPT